MKKKILQKINENKTKVKKEKFFLNFKFFKGIKGGGKGRGIQGVGEEGVGVVYSHFNYHKSTLKFFTKQKKFIHSHKKRKKIFIIRAK